MIQKLTSEAVIRAEQMMQHEDPQIAAIGTRFILDHGMPKGDIPEEEPGPELNFDEMTDDELHLLQDIFEKLEGVQGMVLARRKREGKDPITGALQGQVIPPGKAAPLDDDVRDW